MTGSMCNGLVVMVKFLDRSSLDLSDVIVPPSSEHSKAVASTASAIATSGQGVYAIIVSAEQTFTLSLIRGKGQVCLITRLIKQQG